MNFHSTTVFLTKKKFLKQVTSLRKMHHEYSKVMKLITKLDFWKLSDLVRLLHRYSDSDTDVSNSISVQLSYPLLKVVFLFFHISHSTIVSQVKNIFDMYAHFGTLFDLFALFPVHEILYYTLDGLVHSNEGY